MLRMRVRRRRGHVWVFGMAVGIAVLSLIHGDVFMFGLMVVVVAWTLR